MLVGNKCFVEDYSTPHKCLTVIILQLWQPHQWIKNARNPNHDPQQLNPKTIVESYDTSVQYYLLPYLPAISGHATPGILPYLQSHSLWCILPYSVVNIFGMMPYLADATSGELLLSGILPSGQAAIYLTEGHLTDAITESACS
jgi:hypothetical protein